MKNRPRNADSREFQNTADGEEFYEPFYEWSVWSPCSRTCGVGVKFRGQLCLRFENTLIYICIRVLLYEAAAIHCFDCEKRSLFFLQINPNIL